MALPAMKNKDPEFVYMVFNKDGYRIKSSKGNGIYFTGGHANRIKPKDGYIVKYRLEVEEVFNAE